MMMMMMMPSIHPAITTIKNITIPTTEQQQQQQQQRLPLSILRPRKAGSIRGFPHSA
jgi:hypothetical protein